jgi:acyl dehydratase
MTAKAGIPWRLLRYQDEMLRMGGRIVLHTALRRSSGAAGTAEIAPVTHTVTHTVTRTVAAPPAELVERYVDWACTWAGTAGRYAGELPPHMVSQWSLPLVGELLLRLPYRLASVINQGASLRVHGPLPRDTPLIVRAAIEHIDQTADRARVVVAITTGTERHANLLEARLHMSFLLPGPRAPKTAPQRPPQPQWRTAGLWHADADDGLRFALLTGDFNPIHWCGPLARRSVFGGKVLHGFGSLVRSYEALEPGSFDDIDVRFVRPVPLPCSALSVQVAPEDSADADGWRAVRLAGAGDAVHLAGRLRLHRRPAAPAGDDDDDHDPAPQT